MIQLTSIKADTYAQAPMFNKCCFREMSSSYRYYSPCHISFHPGYSQQTKNRSSDSFRQQFFYLNHKDITNSHNHTHTWHHEYTKIMCWNHSNYSFLSSSIFVCHLNSRFVLCAYTCVLARAPTNTHWIRSHHVYELNSSKTWFSFDRYYSKLLLSSFALVGVLQYIHHVGVVCAFMKSFQWWLLTLKIEFQSEIQWFCSTRLSKWALLN